jgi:hypothetical protein
MSEPIESLPGPSPVLRGRRSRILWISIFVFSVICVTILVIAGAQLIILLGNDARARGMSRILAERFRERDPEFKDVWAGGLSTWENGRSMPATALEKMWNRHYPVIAGKVKSEEELARVRELIRVTCEEFHYDSNLVHFLTRVEP